MDLLVIALGVDVVVNEEVDNASVDGGGRACIELGGRGEELLLFILSFLFFSFSIHHAPMTSNTQGGACGGGSERGEPSSRERDCERRRRVHAG